MTEPRLTSTDASRLDGPAPRSCARTSPVQSFSHTKTTNLTLLCRHHHGIIHRHGWTMTPTTTPDNESHTGYFTITTTDGTRLPTQHHPDPHPPERWTHRAQPTPDPHPRTRLSAGNTAPAAGDQAERTWIRPSLQPLPQHGPRVRGDPGDRR